MIKRLYPIKSGKRKLSINNELAKELAIFSVGIVIMGVIVMSMYAFFTSQNIYSLINHDNENYSMCTHNPTSGKSSIFCKE